MSVGLRVQDEWRPLAERWHEALYGRDGFYRRAGRSTTSGRVRTSATRSPMRSSRWPANTGSPASATSAPEPGELLERSRPAHPTSIGSHRARRPARPTLPPGSSWRERPPGDDVRAGGRERAARRRALPGRCAGRASSAVRIVEVDLSGRRERLGGGSTRQRRRGSSAGGRWIDGRRAEIGRSREEFWADGVTARPTGCASAIDYGHMRMPARRRQSDRVPAGLRVDGRYDGRRDITAHVAVDALQARVGGRLSSQRESLQRSCGPRTSGHGWIRGSRLSMLRSDPNAVSRPAGTAGRPLVAADGARAAKSESSIGWGDGRQRGAHVQRGLVHHRPTRARHPGRAPADHGAVQRDVGGTIAFGAASCCSS